VEERFVSGTRHKGTVTNIADYGAFVQLEGNIEGLVYVTEMSWTKKNIHPSKIVSLGQELEIVVLEVDVAKRRISLGLKQCQENPWQKFVEQHPVGSVLDGVVKNITEFGLFVGVNDELDGMVHLSDLSWDKPGEEVITTFTKNQTVQVKVLDVDAEKERISLGVKQLSEDPIGESLVQTKKGDVVTCTITQITDKGIDVLLANGLTGFIKKGDLSRDRSEQRTERFAMGEKIDAKVVSIDKTTRKASLSIKALEIEEEKQALSEYGSSDSGASLGDILGAAMKKKAGSKKDA
jgi:small subunit ribosomal protein S1